MQTLEVLIAAFDGDPAMMARSLQVVAADRNFCQAAQLRTLQVYGNFQDRGRIDIGIDNTTGKIVGVCLWNTPNPGRFLPQRTQADWRLLQGARLAKTLLKAILMELHLLKYRPAYKALVPSSTSVFSKRIP